MDLDEIQHALDGLSGDQQQELAKRLRKSVAQKLRERRAAEATANGRKVFFRSTALRWTIASLLLFLLVESLVFRIGWYYKYLEPASSAGNVETYLYWLKRFPHKGRPEVMVVGDSRIAEGLSAPIAAMATAQQLRFWNFGIGGTAPRVWYYMLRDADPTRRRFAAIVIPLDEYSDEDHWDGVEARMIDMNFVVGRLRLTDCLNFASSMKAADLKKQALSGCLLKGITLRRDAQAFLQDVPDRIKRTKDFRINGLAYIDAYGGRPEDLRGLSADFEHRTIHFPPDVTGLRRVTVQDMIMPPPAPQKGEMTRYRKLWLGRILDLYKDSPTRIIFLELPRGPISKPEGRVPPTFLKWALGRPRVSALPAQTFRDLERPEVYFDGLHLNRIGRGIFSERLAEQVQPLIERR